ncbi:MAG: response regulator [Gemmobacter sp.]
MPQPDAAPHPPPAPALPLQGLTLLLVEDSRAASDVMRLMAQRSGARLRRADTLHEARRHLARYRPDIVLVDLGLPDGSGLALIRDMAAEGPAAPVAIAVSGDPGLADAARAAGAAAFLAKPLPGLAAVQQLLIGHLTGHWPPAPEDLPLPSPDPLALHEDLARAADLLHQWGEDVTALHYLAGFLAGIARTAGDRALEDAARNMGDGAPGSRAGLRALLAARLRAGPPPLAAGLG